MQDNSFESINLEDYTLDVSDFFSDYIIQEEKTKQDYVVFKGVMKNSPQAVKIYKRVFPNDLEAKQRFKVLMTAFHQGIVLADNIFLSFENDRNASNSNSKQLEYYIYVVEPWFTGYQDKFIPLSDLLKLDLDYMKKQRLFQNLVIIVKSLHTLGVPHLDICPKNIWIEDQFLVYLRPFKLRFESTNFLYTKKLKNPKNSQSIADPRSWYMAPEQTIRDFKQINYADPENSDDSLNSEHEKGFSDFSSDMWSLGCVFAEMFVSLTPVFQSVDTFDRIIRFFEVLGIPKKEDVFYMSQELYETILEHLNSRVYNENEFPLISELTRSLSKSEAKVLTSLLLFNPNKRPRCEILIQFPFFKSYTPERHRNSIDYIAQNDIEEPPQSNKHSAVKNTSFRHTHNESLKEPSTVYQMDNSHDTSIRNMSNWWNIDPIITPKDPYLGQKDIQYRSEVLPNHQRSGTKGNREQQNVSINASRMSIKPEQNTERSRTPTQPKRVDTSYQNESQIMKSNYRSQPVKDSSHLRIDSNFPSVPLTQKIERASTTTNQTAKNSVRLESTRLIQEERTVENKPERIIENLNSTRVTHRGPEVEKENRGSYLNVSQRKDSIKPIPKAKFSINIEVLKNLASHNLDGSYSCRIDIKTKSLDGEAVNLFSHFAPVKDRAAKMDFTGELDLDCEPLLQTYRDKPLKILVFYRGSPKKQKETSTDLFLYGVAEVDLALLLMNSQELLKGKEAPRRLQGWYHIYDAEDNYRTMGQMKIGIQLQVVLGQSNTTKAPQRSSISPLGRVDHEPNIPKHELTIDAKASQRMIIDDIETRKSERARIIVDKENIRYSTLNTQAKERSPLARDKTPIQRGTTRASVLPERSSIIKPKNYVRDITPTRSTLSYGSVLNLKTTKNEAPNSVFSAIENDLMKLNEELKQKENFIEKSVHSKKKTSQYNDDFAQTLQKLRQILEGEEEFNY